MTCPIGTDVVRAATILREGGLAAFPTETVYGLGANAWDAEAVARVFDVKNRPQFDPLIVHVSHSDWFDRLTEEVPQEARKLAELFWPGPLSLVLPKSAAVPDLVTAGLSTVAVRVPDHPLALRLLREADLPIAAPSANAFGRLSPTQADHVAEQLGEKIAYILDGGPCRVGVESTVLLITEHERRLLRPGGLPVEEIEAVVGPVTIPEPEPTSPVARSTDGATSESGSQTPAPLAPGQLPRHYAPRTPLTVIENLAELFDASSPHLPFSSSPHRLGGEEPRPQEPCERVGLLALQPVTDTQQFAVVEALSPRGDLVEAAARFFAALRRLDAAGLDRIVALPFPETGLGRALNDRLRRAARS